MPSCPALMLLLLFLLTDQVCNTYTFKDTDLSFNYIFYSSPKEAIFNEYLKLEQLRKTIDFPCSFLPVKMADRSHAFNLFSYLKSC